MNKLSRKNESSLESAADIDAIIRANEAEERAEREARAASTAAIRADREARARAVDVARSEIARDLGVSASGLASAIQLRQTPGSLSLAWMALRSVTFSDADAIDLELVRGARHALAHTKALPPVRRDDEMFASAKPLRELPRPAIEVSPASDLIWLEPLARMLGLDVPVLAEPDCESINDAHERTERYHNDGLYVRFVGGARSEEDSARSRALADRDFELVVVKYRREQSAARVAYLKALLDLRTKIRDALDAALGSRDIDPAWFHAREVRRYVAGEPRRMTSEIEPVWHAATSLGFRIT